ncbi:MAG: M48 family metalloprotease [Halioglobus sp.]
MRVVSLKARQILSQIGLSWLLAVVSLPAIAGTEDLKLPKLGESSTSMFSAEYEHQIGRSWLRMFRSQAPTVDDPLLFSYLEDLIFRLVTHSQLEDRRIELVVVDNASINAFAVPGGIIGIHNGLLLYAQTEDELATVLAHEIAHLSQRHFSRRVEFQKNQQPLNMAGLLAGLILMATAGGDVGLAALTASQAAAQDSALRYSRSNEAEADRVGMTTMLDAGMDPHAAPAMFERMMQASRYTSSNRIPEFLRTHPLSENRIADTRNRARQYPKRPPQMSLNYQLMRARVVNQLADTPEEAVTRFRNELEGNPRSEEAAHYGLVIALTNAGRADEAGLELDTIWSKNPGRLEYVIADAEIDLVKNRPERAINTLTKQLELYPNNHPLTMTYARALMRNQQAHVAEEVLVAQSKIKPKDPALWYLLAEVQGLSGNIIELHQSRAEYFILNGNLGQAEKQLTYAQKLTENDYLSSAKINQRLQDIGKMREQMNI